MHPDQYQLDAKLAETHWWWVARRQILQHLMDGILGTDVERRILEVGCSTGSNLSLLERYGSVEAMEMFAPAAEYCRSAHPKITVYNEAIPAKLDCQYDIICLFDVLEHIKDDARAIDWIDEHLAPNGTLFLTVPAFQFLWSHYDELAHHYRRYTRNDLILLLSEKFKIEYSTYFNIHLFPIIILTRIVQRIFNINSTHDKNIGSNGIINFILKNIFSLERIWIPRITLPFGVSIFVSARKV